MAASTMIAPYTYSIYSPTIPNRSASAMAIDGRLSGEYWFAPQWGVDVTSDLMWFKINGRDYTRLSGAIAAKLRLSISQSGAGWFSHPDWEEKPESTSS